MEAFASVKTGECGVDGLVVAAGLPSSYRTFLANSPPAPSAALFLPILTAADAEEVEVSETFKNEKFMWVELLAWLY